MGIIHLQRRLVRSNAARISCIAANYSAHKCNGNVHPFQGTPFVPSIPSLPLSRDRRRRPWAQTHWVGQWGWEVPQSLSVVIKIAQHLWSP